MCRVLSGGCMTAIIGPDGRHVVPSITEGEEILIADLDFSLIVNRKRMVDSVGHFSRPDLFRLHATTDPRADSQRLSLRETSHVDARTRECDKTPMSNVSTTFPSA
jgi:nitrilase